MKYYKALLAVSVLTVLLFTAPIVSAQWWLNLGLTAPVMPTLTTPTFAPGVIGGGLTGIMTAPTPSFAPGFTGGPFFGAGISGGLGLFGGTGSLLTALMTAPLPSVAPGIGGGAAFWPTAIMLGTAPVPTIGGAFPALMTAPFPTISPVFGGGGFTPALMLAPTPSVTPGIGGGGLAFWPTAIMLAPGVPTIGGTFPIAMPPVI